MQLKLNFLCVPAASHHFSPLPSRPLFRGAQCPPSRDFPLEDGKVRIAGPVILTLGSVFFCFVSFSYISSRPFFFVSATPSYARARPLPRDSLPNYNHLIHEKLQAGPKKTPTSATKDTKESEDSQVELDSGGSCRFGR